MAPAAVLDAPETDLAPARGVDSPPAPEKSSPEPPGAPPAPFQWGTGSLVEQWAALTERLQQKYAPALEASETRIRGAEKAGGEFSRDVVAPAIADKIKAASVPVPDVPKATPEPPAPDQRARPFLTGAKEPLMALVNGLGLMAQLAMAGTAPTAALGALTGAMNGWAQGDKARADAEWRQYLATVDTIRHENAQARETWEMSMKASGANQAQAEARFVATMAGLGLIDRTAGIEKEGMARILGNLTREQGMLDGIFDKTQKFMQWKVASDQVAATRAQTAAFRQQQLDLQRDRFQQQAEALRERLDERRREFEIRVKEGQASREERAAFHREIAGHRSLMEHVLLQAPQGSLFWDKASGEVRAPSKGELIAKPENFSRVLNQQAPLVDRLAVAGPVLDALDKLIDRITAEAPGQNITQGLINRLRRQAGIGPDIQQFTALKLDAALENAAALSGGTPRISILHMLRGDAQPSEFMTRETAKLVNETTRTTIKNRLSKITGDPESYTKLQSGQVPYALFEKPAKPDAKGAGGGEWKIELVK